MRLRTLATGIIISSLLISMAAACQPSFQSGNIVDDLGRQISIEKVPQRIVSHVPSITETLFAIGLSEKVVGVSEYCDYPEAAKAKPIVGGFYYPSIEKIVDLNPDLVFTDGRDEKLIIQLDELGITCVALRPKDISGILTTIVLVGKITGTKEKAEELVEDMRARMSAITERVKDAPRPQVFYLFAAKDLNNPWAAGPGSFVDSLIMLAGGENIGAKAISAWAQFSVEEVVNSDPEVIIANAKHGTSVTSKEELERHPAWNKITAVKRGKIHFIDGNLVERSGPRIVQGLEEIARFLHPEIFKE